MDSVPTPSPYPNPAPRASSSCRNERHASAPFRPYRPRAYRALLLPLKRAVPTPRTSLPEPMYATLGHALPTGRDWTFEPKYDGMRVIADVSSRGARLITRNGKDKSTQFPEIVLALRELAGRAGRSLVLDG